MTGDRPGTDGASQWVGAERWVRFGSIVIIIACLAAVGRLLPLGLAMDRVSGTIAGMGVWGPLVFALVYVLATILFVPGAVLTLAAGALFGLAWGTAAVSIGSTIGAAVAFVIARYMARAWVKRQLTRFPKFHAIDRAIAERGWEVVALLRLSPVIPFNMQNYAYGLTAIRLWPCVFASWLAMLPGTFAYVYIGYAGRASVASVVVAEGAGRSVGQWIMLVVGLIATIAATVYITKFARRANQRQSVEIDRNGCSPTADHGVVGRMPSPRAALGFALAAVIALIVTGCAYLNASLLKGIFGPPVVRMSEAYGENTNGPTFDHSAFDALLKVHVNGSGGVDYAGLMRDRGALRGYIERIGTAPFEQMGRDEKLALLINGYDAFTLELICEYWNGGDLRSIRDIPGPQRWDAVRWEVGDETWSLNQIEHEQIRPKFAEPRVHFALVCGAVGCPPLRREAYAGDRLEAQLQDQVDYVHAHDRWYRLDADQNVTHLTPLYSWYRGDFEQDAGSVLAYVARIKPSVKQLIGAGRSPRVRWLDYDWSLNNQENIP